MCRNKKRKRKKNTEFPFKFSSLFPNQPFLTSASAILPLPAIPSIYICDRCKSPSSRPTVRPSASALRRLLCDAVMLGCLLLLSSSILYFLFHLIWNGLRRCRWRFLIDFSAAGNFLLLFPHLWHFWSYGFFGLIFFSVFYINFSCFVLQISSLPPTPSPHPSIRITRTPSPTLNHEQTSHQQLRFTRIVYKFSNVNEFSNSFGII